MSTVNYSRLAGVVFAIVALLQLVRGVAGWPISIGDMVVPVWASYVACVVAFALAALGFTASNK